MSTSSRKRRSVRNESASRKGSTEPAAQSVDRKNHADPGHGTKDSTNGKPLPRMLYRIPEASLIMGFGQRKIWSWIASGELAHVRINRSVRISHQAIEKFIQERTQGGHGET